MAERHLKPCTASSTQGSWVSFAKLGRKCLILPILPASGRFCLASCVAVGSIAMHFNWLMMVRDKTFASLVIHEPNGRDMNAFTNSICCHCFFLGLLKRYVSASLLIGVVPLTLASSSEVAISSCGVGGAALPKKLVCSRFRSHGPL